MTRPRPHITDHALVRYLDRIVGIDMEAHRRALQNRVAHAVDQGASALVSEGYRYCLAGNNLVTITPASYDPPAYLGRITRPEE